MGTAGTSMVTTNDRTEPIWESAAISGNNVEIVWFPSRKDALDAFVKSSTTFGRLVTEGTILRRKQGRNGQSYGVPTDLIKDDSQWEHAVTKPDARWEPTVTNGSKGGNGRESSDTDGNHLNGVISREAFDEILATQQKLQTRLEGIAAEKAAVEEQTSHLKLENIRLERETTSMRAELDEERSRSTALHERIDTIQEESHAKTQEIALRIADLTERYQEKELRVIELESETVPALQAAVEDRQAQVEERNAELAEREAELAQTLSMAGVSSKSELDEMRRKLDEMATLGGMFRNRKWLKQRARKR